MKGLTYRARASQARLTQAGRRANRGANRSRGHRGFTLIEALATLLLIALVLPVAMRGIGVAASMAGTTQRKLEAVTLADNKIADMILNEDYQYNQADGTFEEQGWPDYQWSATVDTFESEYLKQITVEVFWTQRNRQRSVIVSTLLYSEEG